MPVLICCNLESLLQFGLYFYMFNIFLRYLSIALIRVITSHTMCVLPFYFFIGLSVYFYFLEASSLLAYMFSSFVLCCLTTKGRVFKCLWEGNEDLPNWRFHVKNQLSDFYCPILHRSMDSKHFQIKTLTFFSAASVSVCPCALRHVCMSS